MIDSYWMFEDKSEDVEFTKQGDAVEYKAWGVISCVQYPIDRMDGNVLGVIYRTPSGRLFRRWRQVHEVNLYKIPKSEWVSINELIVSGLERGSDNNNIQGQDRNDTKKVASSLLH